MRPFILILPMLASMIAGLAPTANAAEMESVENIVVIYAENRSFDNLYGSFPGANGLSGVTPEAYIQRDRDGSVLKELPPIWAG